MLILLLRPLSYVFCEFLPPAFVLGRGGQLLAYVTCLEVQDAPSGHGSGINLGSTFLYEAFVSGHIRSESGLAGLEFCISIAQRVSAVPGPHH